MNDNIFKHIIEKKEKRKICAIIPYLSGKKDIPAVTGDLN